MVSQSDLTKVWAWWKVKYLVDVSPVVHHNVKTSLQRKEKNAKQNYFSFCGQFSVVGTGLIITWWEEPPAVDIPPSFSSPGPSDISTGMLNCKINGTVHFSFLKNHISAPGDKSLVGSMFPIFKILCWPGHACWKAFGINGLWMLNVHKKMNITMTFSQQGHISQGNWYVRFNLKHVDSFVADF